MIWEKMSCINSCMVISNLVISQYVVPEHYVWSRQLNILSSLGKVYFRNGIHLNQNNEDIKTRTLLKIFWQFPTNKKLISQEVLVFDWKYLMASIGGTLGLFIGFSVFDMFSIIIDTIFNRIYAKNEWSLINIDVILSNISLMSS